MPRDSRKNPDKNDMLKRHVVFCADAVCNGNIFDMMLEKGRTSNAGTEETVL